MGFCLLGSRIFTHERLEHNRRETFKYMHSSAWKRAESDSINVNTQPRNVSASESRTHLIGFSLRIDPVFWNFPKMIRLRANPIDALRNNFPKNFFHFFFQELQFGERPIWTRGRSNHLRWSECVQCLSAKRVPQKLIKIQKKRFPSEKRIKSWLSSFECQSLSPPIELNRILHSVERDSFDFRKSYK